MIKQFDDFLDKNLLLESTEYANDVLKKHDYTKNTHDDVIGDSLMHLIDDRCVLNKKLKDCVSLNTELIPNKIGLTFMFAGSSHVWHRDTNPLIGSLTIYLNDFWDKNWGGSFMYTLDEEVSTNVNAIFPKNNLAIVQVNAGVWHCVSPTSLNAPIRMSMQMFQVLSK